MSKDEAQPTDGEWRKIVRLYQLLREMESPDSMSQLKAMIDVLRHDSATLTQVALRLTLNATVPEIKLADFSANGIRRRLGEQGYEARHFQLTDWHLDKLEERVELDPRQLRAQAWRIDLAAEAVVVWIEAYTERRDDLREHSQGRAPSVGLAYLIGETLHCKLSEIAKRLADAKVLPDRETDYDDPVEQWSQLLKRARTRYRQRTKGQK